MPDEKVKVAMFLPPGVAHAVKVQAARQGGGVSELVGNMFLCAHCREPIVDEFVVGTPKLIAPNRYAVFFHKSREACAAASGTRVNFFVDCPNCKSKPHQSFDRTELPGLLKNNGVKFYCITCDHSWMATGKQVEDIAHLLV
jgi:hypothetical protein